MKENVSNILKYDGFKFIAPDKISKALGWTQFNSKEGKIVKIIEKL